jgi:hypothetical protein
LFLYGSADSFAVFDYRRDETIKQQIEEHLLVESG